MFDALHQFFGLMFDCLPDDFFHHLALFFLVLVLTILVTFAFLLLF